MSSLRLLAQFEDALSNYHYSDTARQILADTKLVLLVGATASGRNTTIRELLKSGHYHFIISDTTRAPRENNGVMEQHGVEYFFRSEEEMLEEIKRGEFLEAEVIHGRQVSGISMRELERAMQEQCIAITDIDIGGIQNVVALKPDTIAILMLPPSFETWQQRIVGRGTMSPEVYQSRLETAVRIFEAAQHNPHLHIVINDDVKAAAQAVDDLANGRAQTEAEAQTGQRVLQELLDKTRRKLDESAG